MLVAAATALGGAVLNQTTPTIATTFSDCTMENVILQGNVHTVVHAGVSGDRFHFGEDVRFTGAQGFGVVSGARYVEMDVNNSQANITDFGPQEITVERTMNLTRLGEDQTFGDGDDMRVHTIFHMTLSANGDVTAETDRTRIECR